MTCKEGAACNRKLTASGVVTFSTKLKGTLNLIKNNSWKGKTPKLNYFFYALPAFFLNLVTHSLSIPTAPLFKNR